MERTFAWLGQARRLAKDYERLPETGVAMIHPRGDEPHYAALASLRGPLKCLERGQEGSFGAYCKTVS